MYHGEVNVAQEELNSFLSVAEDLKVKGLTQNNSNEASSSKSTKLHNPQIRNLLPNSLVEPAPSQKIKPIQRQGQYQGTHDDYIQEVVPLVKEEPPTVVEHAPTTQDHGERQQHYEDPVMGTVISSMDDSYGDAGYEDYQGYEDRYDEEAVVGGARLDLNKGDLLQGANQLCQKHDGEKKFECLSCGKMFSDQSNCKRHIRQNHLGENKNAVCPNCNKTELKTNMNRHIKKYCVNRHLFVEEPQQLTYY